MLSFTVPPVRAQTAPPQQPQADRPVGDGILDIPTLKPEVPEIGSPSAEGEEGEDGPAVSLGDDDLKKDPRLADFVLGQAIQARAWKIVEGILRYYSDIPEHDPMMALYAQGALDRQQGRHGRAITAYRHMVESDASLDYVRLDLAAMLFEDKQFREARELFEILRRDPDLVPTAQQAIEQYLVAMRSQTGWHGTVRFGYKYNDNVNSGSPDRYFYFLGLPFEKDPKSLPQSGHATSYSANLNRDFNISGNHFLSVDGTLEGDHYWDEPDWRETTATVRAGYKYRDIKSWLSVQPSFSQLWLGGDPYRRTIGASIEYGRWVSHKWQVMGSYAWFDKKYDLPNFDIYDGDLHALSVTAVHFASPRTILYGGLTAQRDLLEARDESSSRDGASIGFIKQWNSGLNIRGNARYSFRRFRDYSLWDRARIRRDHEYQLDFSVTHDKLRFAGVYPWLSYQHLRVDSSIPSLYSRTGNQLIFSLETSF